jgi:metal-sulfur cluster biosynthetic enzyme
MDEAALYDALRTVDDPEAGMNIVDLGLVYGIEVAQIGYAPARWKATVRMTMTSPACPMGEYLTDAVRDALRGRFPELEEVSVEIVWEPLWTPERMSETARGFFNWK